MTLDSSFNMRLLLILKIKGLLISHRAIERAKMCFIECILIIKWVMVLSEHFENYKKYFKAFQYIFSKDKHVKLSVSSKFIA